MENKKAVEAPYRRLPPLFHLPLMDRDQVAAGVVEYGEGAPFGFGRRGREDDAQFGHAFVLLLDVLDEEGCGRDALGIDEFLVGQGCWVDVWFEEQFQVVGSFWRDDGEPPVVAGWHVLFDDEAQDLGVEGAGFGLVVDEYAGEFDLHWLASQFSGSWR